MDADMKSFLYSAHSIILFPISFLFPCKSIFGKRFRFVTLKMAANKTVSTINFPLSPHLSVTANIGYAHSLNIFCKTLGLTHVFPFRKTLFQKHLFCNTLFNGIFMKFNKNEPWHILYGIIKKEQQKLDLRSFATRFGIIIFPVLKKVKPKITCRKQKFWLLVHGQALPLSALTPQYTAPQTVPVSRDCG